MGEVRCYQCPCGYHMDFFKGAGIRAFKMSVAEQIFSEEFRKLHLQEEEVKKVFVDNVLGECTHCKELRTIARCTYTKQAADNSNVIRKDICPECNNTMQLLENETTILCPKCKKAMESHIVGHWD